MYIYKAAVLGAGTMGAEIAQVITYAGIPVIIKDVNESLVQKGLDKIRAIYKRRVDKGKMSAAEMEQKLALVSGSTKYEDLKDVDIVIEAVPENLEIKLKVFQEFEPFAAEGTIFASNTSALSITKMAAATKRPEKFIGMHFFFPASVMKLVEVIPGLQTSEETIEDVTNFAESLRKFAVRVNECAGFLVNRLLLPYLNEAAYCLQEKAVTRDELDAKLREFGFPMGPLTLVDNIGLDLCVDTCKILEDSFGSRMKGVELVNHMRQEGYYGVKSGAGFYTYGDGKLDRLQEFIEKVHAKHAVKGSQFSVERLLCLMVNEAVLCIEEGVSKPKDIDLAVLAGIGFPQDKGGILHYADEVGLDRILSLLEGYYRQFGERFWPAPRLRRMVDARYLGKKTGKGFFEYTT